MSYPTRYHACAGPCGRAWRRAELERLETGRDHDIVPNLGNPHWCNHCATTVARALTKLPELVAAIHLEALYGTPNPGVRVRTTGNTPGWPGEAARHLTDTIAGGLLEFEDETRAWRGYSPRCIQPEGPAVVAAIEFLTGNLEWLLQEHPASADSIEAPGARILLWERLAVRFTKDDRPRVHKKQIPCPKCGLVALTQAPGDDSIECGSCSNRFREDEYRRAVHRYTYRRAGEAIMAAEPPG